MNQSTFKSQFAGLCEYFSKNQTQPVVDIYWRAFKHFTDEQFIQAVSTVIMENQFFPKVPELISNIPPLPQIENKGSLTWCDNTQKLLDEYGVKA